LEPKKSALEVEARRRAGNGAGSSEPFRDPLLEGSWIVGWR
jgi:hypothetical protein